MRKSIKQSLAFLIVVSLLMSTMMFSALASSEDEKSNELVAAEALHSIGLFLGTGDDADGNPVFGLENGATRIQGLIMLLRFSGEIEEALENEFDNPFTDVTDAYNSPIVAYAFEKGITKGVSATKFEPAGELNASHYLTFMLRALGYEDGTDFEWNKAWELTDKLGITNGEFSATNNELLRGGLVVVSLLALEQTLKGSDETLLDKLIGLEAVPENAADKTAAATEIIKESNKPNVPTPTPTPTPSPAPSGGGSGGGGVVPTPTPKPSSYTAIIPDAEVGDYVRLIELRQNDYNRHSYVEVKTAGQVTVNKAGTYAWEIVSEEYIVVSEGGKTKNLDSVLELMSEYDERFSFEIGDYVELTNMATMDWYVREIDENGQIAVPNGVYDIDWLYYPDEVVVSVNGKATNLEWNPGDFVRFLDLESYLFTAYFEVDEDRKVAIIDGVYLYPKYDVIPKAEVIVSESGKATILGFDPGDFVELFDLVNNRYVGAGFIRVGEDGEVAIPNGKYYMADWFYAKDVLTPSGGKITIPEGFRDEGYVAELIEIEGWEWYLEEIDEEWQVEVPDGKYYYLNWTYPLVFSVGEMITGLDEYGLSEFDYVYLYGWGNNNRGYFRVNGNDEVLVSNGAYVLFEAYYASEYISSVKGKTVNFRSHCDEHEYEYEEGDYVFLDRVTGDALWGYFRVGADGEVAIADGMYDLHRWRGYFPAAYIVVVK